MRKKTSCLEDSFLGGKYFPGQKILSWTENTFLDGKFLPEWKILSLMENFFHPRINLIIMVKLQKYAKTALIDGFPKERYNNGFFVVIFQKSIKALALSHLTKTEACILLYLLGEMQERAVVNVSCSALAKVLDCSERSVRDSIKKLEKRNVLVRSYESPIPRSDECATTLINHRLAFKGSLRNLGYTPQSMPPILTIEGKMLISEGPNEDLVGNEDEWE